MRRREALAYLEGGGCEVEAAEVDGYHLATCPSGEAKLDLLDRAAWVDARDPRVRRLAMEIVLPLGELTAAAVAREIHAWVRDNVRFGEEGFERFQKSMDTVAYRVGDCDCHVRLVMALFRAMGGHARIGYRAGAVEGSGHVWPELWDGDTWQPSETTIQADFGEDPFRAKRRLGVRGRGDLGALGAIDFDEGDEGLLKDWGARSVEAIQAASSPGVVSDYSTPAALFQSTLAESVKAIVGAPLDGLAVGKIGDALLQVAAVTAWQVLGQVVSELAKDLGKDAANVIPVIGSLVSMVIDLYSSAQASGTGPANKDIAVRADWCRHQWAGVRGSGPGMKVLPCDYFVSTGRNGYDEEVQPAVGQALIAITESSIQAYKTINVGGKVLKTPIAGKFFGVSKERQEVFKKLRLAMQASYRKGDGGAWAWPLYLDLLRSEFDRGTLTPDLCGEIVNLHASWELLASVRELGEVTCFYHEKRGLREALLLVDGWRQAVAPFYVQFPALAEGDLKVDVKKRVAELTKKASKQVPKSPVLAGKVSAVGDVSVKAQGGKLSDMQLRALLLARWAAAAHHPAATLRAVQAVQSIARLESGNDPHNLGSVHCATAACKMGAATKQCPDGTRWAEDHTAAGKAYPVCLYEDDTGEKGADRFLAQLFSRPAVVEALEGGDLSELSHALRITSYSAPDGDAKYEAKYALGLELNAYAIAHNLKEEQVVRRGGSSGAAWAVGLAAAVAVGGGVYAAHRAGLLKKARDRVRVSLRSLR